MTYYGKHNLSRKAVDLQLLMIQPPQPNTSGGGEMIEQQQP